MSSNKAMTRDKFKERNLTDTTLHTDDTSNTFQEILVTETTNTTRTIKEGYSLDQFYNEELETMKNRILTLEKKLESASTDIELKYKYYKMKEIANKIIHEKDIPNGKYLALTYDRELVAEEDTMIDLLKKISSLNQDDIFIWESGNDFIESW